MNIHTSVAAIVVAVAAALPGQASAAGCTESFSLGSMGPPGVTWIGNDFYAATSFNDCYNFTLSNSADAFGLTLEWDFSHANNIDLAWVALSGGSLAGTVVDNSPASFSFSNLLAGAYQLVVSGAVTGSWSWAPVGYAGALVTTRDVAAPVPEPETYAMLALGLAVVGWSARRSKQQQ
jgi:PEP-CTERM motif